MMIWHNKRGIAIKHLDGIAVTPSEYQRITFVMTNEEQAGWHPAKSELLALIKSDRQPSKQIRKDMIKLDQQMKHDEAF